MKIHRRGFLAGVAAAGTMLLPAPKLQAAVREDSYATLIDLTKCDGCKDKEEPACVSSCRNGNQHRFPIPEPEQIRDYWPQKKHEDWSNKQHINNRFTPYNWIFVQHVKVEGKDVSIPRRCMHCDNPPCAKLCPFGVKHKTVEGPVYIDHNLCLGGAKCRTVCPWSVPQRQAGVGIYTHFQKYIPAGGGVMYKCDLCRDRLKENKEPFCISSCPQKAMAIGKRNEIFAHAVKLKEQYNGHLYGMDENGGTSTIYVSDIPFEKIDEAIVTSTAEKGKKKEPGNKQPTRMHKPKNILEKQNVWSKITVGAPLLGALAAFFLASSNSSKKDKSNE